MEATYDTDKIKNMESALDWYRMENNLLRKKLGITMSKITKLEIDLLSTEYLHEENIKGPKAEENPSVLIGLPYSMAGSLLKRKITKVYVIYEFQESNQKCQP